MELDAVEAEQLWSVSDGSGVTSPFSTTAYPNHPDLNANVVGQYDAGDQKPTSRPRARVRHPRYARGGHSRRGEQHHAWRARRPARALPGGLTTRPAGCPMDSGACPRHSPRGRRRTRRRHEPEPRRQNLGQHTVDALRAACNAGIIIVGAAGAPPSNGQAPSIPSRTGITPRCGPGATDRDDRRGCYNVGPELFIAAPGGDGWRASATTPSTAPTTTTWAHPQLRLDGGHQHGCAMVAGVVPSPGAVPSASDDQIRRPFHSRRLRPGSPATMNSSVTDLSTPWRPRS